MTTDIVWEIPNPLSTLDVRLDADTVTTVRQHGNPSGTRILLSHGSGFTADLYYPFWSLLANDYDVMVYDLRNHGWNSVGIRKDHNIPTLVCDHDIILESIDREYGNKPTIGIFHSLTSIVTILSCNELYSALVLFDPPLAKHDMSQTELLEAAALMAAKIRQREDRFKSREEFVEFLKIHPSFKKVAPGVHELMALTTLRESESGDGYELRCPREYEAQLMEYGRSFFPLLDLDLIACPKKIVGADPTLPHSYLPTLDQRSAYEVDYDFIPETTHLLQLEKPEECVAVTREFLERHDLA